MRYTTPTRAPRVESASSNQGVLGQAQRKKTLSPGLPKSWMEPFLGRESHVLGGGGGGGGGGGQGEEFNQRSKEARGRSAEVFPTAKPIGIAGEDRRARLHDASGIVRGKKGSRPWFDGLFCGKSLRRSGATLRQLERSLSCSLTRTRALLSLGPLRQGGDCQHGGSLQTGLRTDGAKDANSTRNCHMPTQEGGVDGPHALQAGCSIQPAFQLGGCLAVPFG